MTIPKMTQVQNDNQGRAVMERGVEKLDQAVEKHYSDLLKVVEKGRDKIRDDLKDIRKEADKIEAIKAEQDAEIAELKRLAEEKLRRVSP